MYKYNGVCSFFDRITNYNNINFIWEEITYKFQREDISKHLNLQRFKRNINIILWCFLFQITMSATNSRKVLYVYPIQSQFFQAQYRQYYQNLPQWCLQKMT